MSRYLTQEAAEAATIKANSVATSTITAESAPNSSWGCQELIVWHKRLVERYGKEAANEKYILHWDDLSTWNYAKNFCRYDNGFVAYFMSQGLDLRSFISAIFTNTTQAVVSTTDDVVKTLDQSTGAFASSAKTAKIVIPVLIVALGAGALFYANTVASNIAHKTK
jgi:hypothetical protein